MVERELLLLMKKNLTEALSQIREKITASKVFISIVFVSLMDFFHSRGEEIRYL